jgi:hypothetical protein
MFEEIGFSKDYYSLDKKYLGSLNCKKDREIYGFLGRKKEIIEFDIVLRKKKYKKGTELLTELFPLSGKLLNK